MMVDAERRIEEARFSGVLFGLFCGFVLGLLSGVVLAAATWGGW
jgi:hypothetical protein